MRQFRSLVVLTAAAFAALGLAVSAGAAASVVAPRAATTVARTTSPQLALQRALALFAPGRVDAAYRTAVRNVHGRDATLVLRDLVAARPALSRSDRRLADALLARPTDGANVNDDSSAIWNSTARAHKKRFCNTHFCIHWTTRTTEAPSLTDTNPHNGRPDYIDKTIKNMNTVWSTEIGKYDYQRPLRDSDSGGHHGGNPNRRIDIFISNIGNVGLYGYCTSDDPSAGRQLSAYCVIDDNFSPSEFTSGATRNNANKVTLAHEFFHAVQFAYDTFDDPAVMEGTATWMEDQVFTSINDNRQYLDTSPLGSDPYAPLDLFASSGLFNGWQYGTWIWYRFLSEHLGAGTSDAPAVIRQLWNQAVGTGPSHDGLGALAVVLTNRGTSMANEMRIFGEWNTSPGAPGHYREGGAYSAATPLNGGTLNTTNDGTINNYDMARRSNDYIRFAPPSTSGTKLQVSGVSIPASARIEVIPFSTATTAGTPVNVTSGGTIPFSADGVHHVVFVFTNSGASAAKFDLTLTVLP